MGRQDPWGSGLSAASRMRCERPPRLAAVEAVGTAVNAAVGWARLPRFPQLGPDPFRETRFGAPETLSERPSRRVSSTSPITHLLGEPKFRLVEQSQRAPPQSESSAR